MLLEDMLVIDAATLYPRSRAAARSISLDVIDGATIKPLIGEDGRSPEPPDPAYQQVLHGVPAADFCLRRAALSAAQRPRSHRLYGFSPVEQIALTINIALRREAATLDYYNTGSIPDSFATLPKEWTVDQITQFQDYFDALMSGNLGAPAHGQVHAGRVPLIETRQPPLKDQYDEWLARVICYAFSVPASAFVTQVNRATSETLRMQATQEGLVPLKAWVKSALDQVIQVCLGERDLEFVWVGDDGVDPLQQAQTLTSSSAPASRRARRRGRIWAWRRRAGRRARSENGTSIPTSRVTSRDNGLPMARPTRSRRRSRRAYRSRSTTRRRR